MRTTIAIALCMIICAYAADNTTNGTTPVTPPVPTPTITVPSAGTTAVTTQQTAAKTAAGDAKTAVGTAMSTLMTAAEASATAWTNMQTQSATMTNLAGTAAQAAQQLAVDRAAVVATTAAQAAAQVAVTRATGVDTCAGNVVAWQTARNKKVTEQPAGTAVDFRQTLPAGTANTAYQTARNGNVAPDTFKNLLNDLTTANNAVVASATTLQSQAAGVMRQSVTAALWTAFTTAGGADEGDLTKLLLDVGTTGWKGFQTDCGKTAVNGASSPLGTNSVCAKADYIAWYDNALAYVDGATAGEQKGTGPQFWNAQGSQLAYAKVSAMMAAASPAINFATLAAAVNPATTPAAGTSTALETALTDLATPMGAYKTQATLVMTVLNNVVADAAAQVSADTTASTSGTPPVSTPSKNDQASTAVSDAQGAVTNAKNAVDAAVATTGTVGAYAAAKTALTTARATLNSKRDAAMTGLTGLWTAQVALNNAAVVQETALQANTSAAALASNMQAALTAWQGADQTVNTQLDAAAQALTTQKNATLYMIYPPKPTTRRF